MSHHKRSEFNRGFLMAATHPFFQIAWSLLALYCLLTQKPGWLLCMVVCFAIAITQVIIRNRLKKEVVV